MSRSGCSSEWRRSWRLPVRCDAGNFLASLDDTTGKERSTMPDHADLNPFAPDVLEDPYAVYAELRRRGMYQLPNTTMFIATRFRDVEYVLMHPEVFSVHGLTEGLTRDTPEIRAIEAQGWPAVDVLSKADPLQHTGYRGVVNRPFSAQSVKQ